MEITQTIKIEKLKQRTISRKYVDIYKEKIIQSLKSVKEYQINFWLMNLFDFFQILSMMVFFSILTPFIGEIIDYNMLDWFLYLLLNLVSWKVLWLNTLRDLSQILLKGDLNVFLTKPVNPFVMVATSRMPGSNFVALLYIFPMIFYIIFINNYIISNLLLFLPLVVFSWFYFMSFFNFLKSTAFFMKNNIFLTDFLYGMNSATNRFTPLMFEKLHFSTIFFLMPSAIHSFFAIEILKGRLDLFIFYISYILLTFIFLIIGTYLLWHYGLKKYEAFG